jgi:rhodanese-related sulfurtransferase
MKAIIITIVVIGVLYVFYKTYSTSHVDKSLPQLISKGAIILDVRTNREFEGGHIKGAVNNMIKLSSVRCRVLNLQTRGT